MTWLHQWASHGIKRTGWEMDPTTALSGLALLVGLVLMAAFYLALSSQTAVLGRRLEALESQREALQREIARLEVEIAQARSATVMMQRAQEMGFRPAQEVHFLAVPRWPAIAAQAAQKEEQTLPPVIPPPTGDRGS